MPKSHLSLSALCMAALLCIGLGGCNRKTPEERLQKVMEFAKQNDPLSAEVEAKKIIEKYPADPAALNARILLAQIYESDKRYDEAVAELETALETLSQKDPMGQQTLQLYLRVLLAQQKFDEAIKVTEKYQQEYAEDAGTSLSLIVARADIKTQSGDTTSAREIITGLMEVTTTPAELSLYRNMVVTTYLRDGDTTSAIQFFEDELAEANTDTVKRELTSALASAYASQGNYDKSRDYLEQSTRLYETALRDELDSRRRLALALNLGQKYGTAGNLPGERRIYQAAYDSGLTDPQAINATVFGLTQNLLRQGETSAAVAFLRDAAGKYPTTQFGFGQQAVQLEAMHAQGKLQEMAPMDTSTLALKYMDEPVLAPANLSVISGTDSSTTGTERAEGVSTATEAADNRTTPTDSDSAQTAQTTATATEATGTAETTPTL